MSYIDTDRVEAEQAIHSSIGWALTKDFDKLFSSVAQDEDFFIFHPDSKSTIIGFEAFKSIADRWWRTDAFKATDYSIKELRITFAELGNVAWYSCFLDDHAEWNGQPSGLVTGGAFPHPVISKKIESPIANILFIFKSSLIFP